MEHDADLVSLRAFTDGCNGDYLWAGGDWWVCVGHRLWRKLAPGQRAYNRIS